MSADPIYRLTLRPSASADAAESPHAASDRLLRIPGVAQVDSNCFRFGQADEHGVMQLDFTGEAIEVGVPRSWVQDKGPQVFALVFMLAEWLHWEVYDPQVEDVLKKDVVLQGLVAMRQAQRERGSD